jgi:hypothetical protein
MRTFVFRKDLTNACIFYIIENMKKQNSQKIVGFATVAKNGKITVRVGKTRQELNYLNTKVIRVKYEYLGFGKVTNVEFL